MSWGSARLRFGYWLVVVLGFLVGLLLGLTVLKGWYEPSPRSYVVDDANFSWESGLMELVTEDGDTIRMNMNEFEVEYLD